MHRVSSVISGVCSTSSTHRLAALERGPHRAVVEAELGQAQAGGVGADADAVQGRHGVRRRVADAGVGVEHHHAVADAGLGGGLAVARERERAGR